MLDPHYKRGRSFTGTFNMTGMPSMSVPCGFSSHGLPLAIMLSGRPFDEATVLRCAHAYQGATSWHRQHPDLDAPAVAHAGPPPNPADQPASPQITANVVRQRAAVAGLKIDDVWLDDVASGMESALAPLRGLDLHAMRPVEPVVRFSAAW